MRAPHTLTVSKKEKKKILVRKEDDYIQVASITRVESLSAYVNIQYNHTHKTTPFLPRTVCEQESQFFLLDTQNRPTTTTTIPLPPLPPSIPV